MDDHDLLIRIDERTEHFDERMEYFEDRIEEALVKGSDRFLLHEKRLQDLERNQSKLMTYVIIIGGVITIGVNALPLVGKLWK